MKDSSDRAMTFFIPHNFHHITSALGEQGRMETPIITRATEVTFSLQSTNFDRICPGCHLEKKLTGHHVVKQGECGSSLRTSTIPAWPNSRRRDLAAYPRSYQRKYSPQKNQLLLNPGKGDKIPLLTKPSALVQSCNPYLPSRNQRNRHRERSRNNLPVQIATSYANYAVGHSSWSFRGQGSWRPPDRRAPLVTSFLEAEFDPFQSLPELSYYKQSAGTNRMLNKIKAHSMSIPLLLHHCHLIQHCRLTLVDSGLLPLIISLQWSHSGHTTC